MLFNTINTVAEIYLYNYKHFRSSVCGEQIPVILLTLLQSPPYQGPGDTAHTLPLDLQSWLYAFLRHHQKVCLFNYPSYLFHSPVFQGTGVTGIPCRWTFNPGYMHSFAITKRYFFSNHLTFFPCSSPSSRPLRTRAQEIQRIFYC
jgi:hypothetical protein